MPALVRAAICLALLVPSSGLLLMNATDEAAEWHPGAATRSLAKVVHKIEAFINSTAASVDGKKCMCTTSIGKDACVDHEHKGRVTPYFHDGHRCCKLTGQHYFQLVDWAGGYNIYLSVDLVEDTSGNSCFETFKRGCCTIKGKEGQNYGVRVEKTLKQTLEGNYRIKLMQPYVTYQKDIETLFENDDALKQALKQDADKILPCTRFHVGGTCSLHSQPETQCCCDVQPTCVEVEELDGELGMYLERFKPKPNPRDSHSTITMRFTERNRIEAVVAPPIKKDVITTNHESQQVWRERLPTPNMKIDAFNYSGGKIINHVVKEPKAPAFPEMPELSTRTIGTDTWKPVPQWAQWVKEDDCERRTLKVAHVHRNPTTGKTTVSEIKKNVCVAWVWRRCPPGKARYTRQPTCQGVCPAGQSSDGCRCKKTCK